MRSHDNLPPPLIVTLRLDKETQDYFDVLRRKYFPSNINYLDAHLSLFHQLPDSDPVRKDLHALSRRTAFSVRATEFYHTGYGVACKIESAELSRFHLLLQQTFRSFLIPQDLQIIRPHVTVQNKVSPGESKKLVQQLKLDFKPFAAQAIGLDSWLYLNGPWKHQEFFGFEID